MPDICRRAPRCEDGLALRRFVPQAMLFHEGQPAGLIVDSVNNFADTKLGRAGVKTPLLASSKVPVQRFFQEGLSPVYDWSIPVNHQFSFESFEVTIPLRFCVQLCDASNALNH